MFRNVICNAHWMLKGLWNIVWGWLDPFIQQKIILVGYSDCTKTLLEYIDEETLEESYGGKRPDIQHGEFFPPKF